MELRQIGILARANWKSWWTTLECKVRRRYRLFVMESGERITVEDVELSCPFRPPEAACEDHSW